MYTFKNINRRENVVRTVFPGAYYRIHLLRHCVVNRTVTYRKKKKKKSKAHYSQTVLTLVRQCSYCMRKSNCQI